MLLLRLLIVLGSMFFGTAALCLAQSGTGAVQGTVKDATGAVIPKAKVTVVHTATARQFNTETNEVGFFLLPAMQSGAYQVTIEFAGMETWKGELTLVSGQSAMLDPVLKAGTTATSITVAGDVTPLVTTTNATVATVLERQRIEQLPLNGRFITNLIYMATPGVESGSVPRVYGLRYATELLQDGAVLENREWQSLPARPPGIDTIGEFRAETNNSSAKFNRPGTFMLTTKSGTNEVHGSIFETHRNSGFGVARARQDTFLKPPHLVRNEFGASVGAPVFIPKLYNGRNRTFFFFAYEGYQLRQASTRQINVPTQAMRSGDFSGLIDSAGRRFTLYDPSTTNAQWGRTPFVNNQIPVSRQSPLSKYLYGITPMPTTAENPLIGVNWTGTGFNNTRQHTETLRVDHRVSDRTNLFFRYSHSPARTELTSNPYNQSPTTLDGRANAYMDEGVNDSGIANLTHNFSPTFFSETQVSVARDYRGQLPYTGTAEIASGLGLPNPFNGVGFPRIPYAISSSTGGGMSYDSSINPTINYGRIYNFDENLTKIHGRHEIQFGGRMRFEQLETLNDQQISQGQVDFASVNATGLYDPTSGTAYSAAPFTGHTAANFYMGLGGAYSARFNRSWYRPRVREYALYIQDNFKVNSRLTLNFGLRWEFNSPINERDGQLFGFDEKTKSIILGRPLQEMVAAKNVLPAIYNAYQNLGVKFTTADQAGLPSTLVYSNKWDFGPRTGFAYRLGSGNRTTVVRGGYSIFAYPESLRLFSGQVANSMPGLGTLSYNLDDATQSPDGLPNYNLRSVPNIVAGVNSSQVLDVNRVTGITRGSGSLYYMDPNQPTARAHQWNFMIERELFSNTVAKVGYIGTHGTRMSQWYSLNDNQPGYVWYQTTKQPFPTGEFANVARRLYDQQVYGAMQRYQKTGWSNFNGIQLEFEHRYSKGYAFQVFYVMSNAMRVAGDGWRDDTMRPAAYYLPGAVPTDDQARNRLLYYRRDTGIPKHRVNWNFLVDLPFGKGKPIGGNAGRALNTLIGGWQVAGTGQLTSRYFQLPTNYWGQQSNVEVYGTQYKIQDCRTGVCYDGYLYWNGYIPANRINSVDAQGRPNGVMGVPQNYVPVQKYIIPIPANGGSSSDPNQPFYESNNVVVPLSNGVQQRVGYDTGLHPLQNQFVLAPMLWNMQASAFKAIPITERVIFRFNIDFLNNVFNMPGTNVPGSDGIILTRTSANSPRVLQLTGRITW
ncbi:MAG: carboxypeptidase regulatory-like domain-containing protein [Bryobacterales bacterium]|nr:carboxypeptidase regulatory-like domain-containing protein [Bryobacterales bacterium]